MVYSYDQILKGFKSFFKLIGVLVTQNQNRTNLYEIALFGNKSDSKMTALLMREGVDRKKS
jgi:hypothetical protein